MTARAIDVHAAQRLIDAGALLVDVREPDEHARQRISYARLSPLSQIQAKCRARNVDALRNLKSKDLSEKDGPW